MRITQYELMLRETTTYEWSEDINVQLDCADTVYRFLTEGKFALGSRPEEHLITLAVDCKGKLIGLIESSIGELSATPFSIRQIMMFACQCNAAAIIVCHNHPSMDVTPSQDDIMATRRLAEACRIMQMQLIDHLIISNRGYTSMRVEGII